jgi:hypothetical protein
MQGTGYRCQLDAMIAVRYVWRSLKYLLLQFQSDLTPFLVTFDRIKWKANVEPKGNLVSEFFLQAPHRFDKPGTFLPLVRQDVDTGVLNSQTIRNGIYLVLIMILWPILYLNVRMAMTSKMLHKGQYNGPFPFGSCRFLIHGHASSKSFTTTLSSLGQSLMLIPMTSLAAWEAL